MKAIETPIIVNRISSRADGSLSFSAVTPELNTEEKVAFMELQNQNLRGIFYPEGPKDVPLIKVDKEVEHKTHSQRLRAVMYKCWEMEKDVDFEVYYRQQMERLIDLYKSKLNG